MRLHIFGTCGGSEPMPGRHHTSFAVAYQDRLYWFDAGETCSHTAHLMGVDLTRTRAIFISHTHMDHIGGLGNLFWTLRKLETIGQPLRSRQIDLFIPERTAWEHILGLLRLTEGGFACDFDIAAHPLADGLLFTDQGLRVSALHNSHLPPGADGAWRSFGFAIEADGKKVVYSGDTGGVADLLPLLDGCDLLLMETGHHQALAVVEQLRQAERMPARLAFLHHGRAILNDAAGQTRLLKQVLGDRVCVLNDGDTLTV